MNSLNLLQIFLSLSLIGLVSCTQRSDAPGQPDRIARGKYLVQATGCSDCHTPHDHTGAPIQGKELIGHPENEPLPSWDQSQLAKHSVAAVGHTSTAFASPLGVSVAANLTPDMETGIGKLTAEALITSWRTGRHWQQDRPVLPPMPVESLRNLNDEDIRAIHAYLMSLAPVRNRVPDPKPAPVQQN